MRSIRVVVNGANGRMGREVVQAVQAAADMELVGECDLGDDLVGTARLTQAEVIVDFTVPSAAMENARKILDTGCAGVIGTTGFTQTDIVELRQAAQDRKPGFLIAPNFAIGAVLMMRFAGEAARFMPEVEVIELHHPAKADAPSGTALKTAALVAAARKEAGIQAPSGLAAGAESRGKMVEGIYVHSVRLSGLLAHQEVIFGSEGQTLSIRHDTISRAAFMPGVLLGVREMVRRSGFYYGLESMLFE